MVIIDKRNLEKRATKGCAASAAEIRMENKLPQSAGNAGEDHGECLV
jgi:hypothetical protein